MSDTPTLHSAILDALPTGLWVAEAPSGRLAYANSRFAEILGMGARDDVAAGEYAASYSILGRNGQPFPEERLPFTRALRERCSVVVDDIVIQRPDGQRAYVRAFGKPLFDSEQTITHVIVVFIDISAEVHAQHEGEKTRAHLETALHHAPIILFGSNREGVINVSEGAALAGLGFAPGQLVGQNVFELYKTDPLITANIRRAIAGESFTTITHHGPTALESWLGPLRDQSGEICGYSGVSTDVTERLRLQRQMTHTDRMTVLGRLAASVAHEINNPLTYAMEAVRLATHLGESLDKKGADVAAIAGELKLLLANAAEGVERVRLIARDLKAFAHPDDDRRGPVLIDTTVQTAARLVQLRTGMRAHLNLHLRSEATVHADENRLVQVFSNLLLNAADAVPLRAQMQEQNVIRVSSYADGDHVIIEVADNGPGIPTALRDQVFEPFFTTKAVGEGTGLGLHMTRTLISALEGTIEVGAAPEGGALFTVRLPIAVAINKLLSTTPLGARPGRGELTHLSQSAPLHRPRVLIIDDEPMITRVFTASLEDRCDVEVASSGRAALEKLVSNTRYDFIFCDLMMSDIGGAELHAELRDKAPGREKELIFMTGGVYDPAVGRFLSRVTNKVLDKPFDIRHAVLGDEPFAR